MQRIPQRPRRRQQRQYFGVAFPGQSINRRKMRPKANARSAGKYGRKRILKKFVQRVAVGKKVYCTVNWQKNKQTLAKNPPPLPHHFSNGPFLIGFSLVWKT